MLRWRKRIRKMTYLMTDIAVIMLALILNNLFYTHVLKRILSLSSLETIGMLSLTLFFVITLYVAFQVYESTIEHNGLIVGSTLLRMVIVYLVSSLLLGAALFYMHVNMSRLYIGTLFIAIILVTILDRVFLKLFLYKDSEKSEAVRNILVVGQSRRGMDYIKEIKKHNYLNFNLLGYVSIKKPGNYEDLDHIGTLDELPEIMKQYVIDEIAVARPLSYDERLREMLNECQDMGITITMILDTQNTDTAKAHVAMVGSLPVLKFHTVSLNESQIFAKRMLDVVGAMVGMVFFGIAFLIVGPIIKLETPGPVIFKQDRVGKNGRVFKVWKFRSMGVNAEEQKTSLLVNNEMSGHMFKMTNDPRITKIGAFIRKTSIDELPQFYNVLKGDMSLVGTRPPTVNEVKEYERHHRKRISITPGITGNWQVSGRSDIEDFEEVVRLDSEYIENWSLWSDIHILFKTVWVVVAGRGSK